MAHKKIIQVLILGMFFLAACSGQPTPQVEETQPSASPDPSSEGYPSPQAVEPYLPPYPIEEVVPPTPDVVYSVPEPGDNTGVITGTLLDVESGEPLQYQNVYLGVKIYMTPGPDYTYGLYTEDAPRTVTDKDGKFAIGDIPPGKYIVFVWTPFRSSVVMTEDTKTELEITINAGETQDLGAIKAANPLY